jgi:hypothetical protein
VSLVSFTPSEYGDGDGIQQLYAPATFVATVAPPTAEHGRSTLPPSWHAERASNLAEKLAVELETCRMAEELSATHSTMRTKK